MNPRARIARVVVSAGLVLAVGVLPVHAIALGEDDARHLLNRTGFGATPAEIAQYAGLEREAAVDRILDGTRTEATLAAPAFVDDPFDAFHKLRTLSAEERKAYQSRNTMEGLVSCANGGSARCSPRLRR